MLNDQKHYSHSAWKGWLFAALTVVLFIAVVATWRWALHDVSGDVAAAIRSRSRSMQLSSQIRDIRGQSVGVFSDETRYVVPLGRVPQVVRNAFLAAEDDGFYKLIGVSPRGIIRAAVANVRRDRFAQGGSTITQQLVRQFLLPRDKTFARKIREVILAIVLERQMSKNEILETWLNSVYLGNNSWGVETAARHYFNKGVDGLTLAEAGLLAGLPQAPSRYAPHLRPQMARKRQLYVLSRMSRLGWAKESDVRIATSGKVRVVPVRPELVDQAPWVTEAVRLELWRRLEQKDLPKSGLVVNTTIDGTWQRSLQTLMSRSFADARLNGLETSAVILDAKSGEVRAVVGGSDFSRNQFNRAFNLFRPVGAAIYPMVFAWGIESGVVRVSGYSSLADAAVKSRFAEAEQVAPDIGYGLVRDKLTGLGFTVKDAMAIDELHGSPLTLARAFLSVAGSRPEVAPGLITSVRAKGHSIYTSEIAKSTSASYFSPAVAWTIRQWMAIGSRADSVTLAGEPLIKSVKGWNAWWVIPRNDVVMVAWVGAERSGLKNPAALKNSDAKMDLVLSTWIRENVAPFGGVGPTPQGISYHLFYNGSGRAASRLPFITSDQGAL